MNRFAGVVCLGLGLLASACGGGTEAPDGAPDASPPPDGDEPDAGYAACREMQASPEPLPVHMAGDVTGGGADLTSPDDCAIVDTPFGVDSAGEDRVVRITGLSVGTEYGVVVESEGDLGFYVVTGCSTPNGPAANECALFVDATLSGGEVGRFVATGATAWVVIDSWSTHPPSSGEFTLDVYPIACEEDTDCGGATPACLFGRCVGCVDDFDCPSLGTPRCNPVAHACVAGDASCLGDDTAEPEDDGPAGAPVIAVDYGGLGTVTGAVCDEPPAELDYRAFVVTAPGETWRFDLGWSSGADLDLYAFDATGALLGFSFYEQPERIALTYLEPGTYYVVVDNYGAGGGAAVPWTLTARRSAGAGCATTAHCAAEYRNQIYRGACVAGSCESILGDGGVPEGGACDSTSDCAAGLRCPSFYFVADADTRNTCARTCDADADCAPLGSDFVCTTYLQENFCVPKCTNDLQCPTSPATEPETPPWYRLTCELATGRCVD